MKRVLTFSLCLLMVFSTTNALASMSFSYTGTATSYLNGSNISKASIAKNWHLTWIANAKPTPSTRAVIRIFSGNDYASSEWVYSSASTAYHPYKPGYGEGKRNIRIRGHMHSADTGNGVLNARGTFYN